MEPHQYLDRLRADGDRLIDLAAADLGGVVPHCPGWDNAKLLSHCLRVWGSVAWALEHRVHDAPGRDSTPPRPDPGEEVAAARVQLARLVDALGAIDPDELMWTFGATTTARFHFRRMANETLIHRVDAEQAAGVSSEIDADHAVDAIDELFTEMVRTADPDPGGSLHLHRIDGEGEWLLVVDDGAVVVTHEHAKGDAAVRASAADLLLALWSRRSLADLEVFGDESVAQRWINLAP